MEKIHFYEYIDLVDPRNKLKEIEKKANREDKYSWSILVDEIKRKVKNNKHINDFIEKVNKNISFSNIYYNSNNNHIDNFMDKINDENSEYLFELQRISLLYSLEDEKFYNLQKNKIYKDMLIISKINYKIKNNDEPNDKLKEFINGINEIFEKRRNLIRLINKKVKKESISNEDDIMINIKDEKDIITALVFIDNNKKIYDNIKLPIFIKIREYNNYSPLMVKAINKLVYYINIIYRYKNIIPTKKEGNIIYINNHILNNNNKMCFEHNKYINPICFNIDHLFFLVFILLIINVYKFLGYFDLWRKKHKTI